MSDTVQIANTVAQYFGAVDKGDWQTAQSLMSNPYHLDYSSFGAGPAANLEPENILNSWRDFLPGFDATHHQIANLNITKDGDVAVVDCYGTASHFIADAPGGSVWNVIGTYTLSLARTNGVWTLTGTVFHFKFQNGNTDLPTLASERVAQGK